MTSVAASQTTLSCRVDGWRGGKSIEDFKKLLYWPTAHRKILFGSDVHLDEVEEVLADQKRILEGIGWDEPMLADFLHGNGDGDAVAPYAD